MRATCAVALTAILVPPAVAHTARVEQAYDLVEAARSVVDHERLRQLSAYAALEVRVHEMDSMLAAFSGAEGTLPQEAPGLSVVEASFTQAVRDFADAVDAGHSLGTQFAAVSDLYADPHDDTIDDLIAHAESLDAAARTTQARARFYRHTLASLDDQLAAVTAQWYAFLESAVSLPNSLGYDKAGPEEHANVSAAADLVGTYADHSTGRPIAAAVRDARTAIEQLTTAVVDARLSHEATVEQERLEAEALAAAAQTTGGSAGGTGGSPDSPRGNPVLIGAPADFYPRPVAPQPLYGMACEGSGGYREAAWDAVIYYPWEATSLLTDNGEYGVWWYAIWTC
ncbi:hypothetical protein GCM10009808_20520 [Microbacterium sediminicola]|uniref:Uncharacterized protein n=1 Tax=Microbacterium sediminicola TaxID=415210 RepID=A0ABN2ID38_9MICO